MGYQGYAFLKCPILNFYVISLPFFGESNLKSYHHSHGILGSRQRMD